MSNTSFRWRAFIDAFGSFLEGLSIPVGEGANADTYHRGKNFSVVEVGLDTEGLDYFGRMKHILLTAFDESGSMTLSNGRRIQQTRIVRLTRRGGAAATALTECGRVFESIVNRGRFTSPTFVAQLRGVVRTPSVLIRNTDGSVHAECILEFLAYSKP